MTRAGWPVVVLLVASAACSGSPQAGTTSTAAAPTASPTTSTGTATTATTAGRGYPEVAAGEVGSWVPEVVARIPHDPEAFTQGLVVDGEVVWESTGLYGASTLRRTDRRSGDVIEVEALDPDQFGEGLELVGDRLVQLTWQEETALLWDPARLDPVGTFGYEGEGWGLCALDDGRLAMSDGSATLTIRDPATFEPLDEVEVTRDGVPEDDLNELECVDGLVFANVWLTDEIVVIGRRRRRCGGDRRLCPRSRARRRPGPGRAQRHRLRPGHRHLPAHRQAVADHLRGALHRTLIRAV